MSYKRHVVTEADVGSAFPMESEIAGSYGDGSHKKLTMIINGPSATPSYRVYEKRESVGAYASLTDAITHYNRLP